MQKHYDIPLHDIKPLLEVEEYSLLYSIGLAFFILLLLLGALYLLYKWLHKRNAYNIRKEHFRLLEALDFSDTKNSAYLVTLYGATFKDDSPRHSEMYTNLTQRLSNYKYKKEVEVFDDEVRGYIELYKGMIDV